MNQLVVVGDQVVNNQADGSPQQQSDRGFEQSYLRRCRGEYHAQRIRNDNRCRTDAKAETMGYVRVRPLPIRLATSNLVQLGQCFSLVEHHPNKFALCQPLVRHTRLRVKIQRSIARRLLAHDCAVWPVRNGTRSARGGIYWRLHQRGRQSVC